MVINFSGVMKSVSWHLSRQFKCSLDYAKKSLFRSLNAIFDKIGRNASEEVIMELIRSKCIPILICGLECFALIYEIVRQRALMLLKLANLSLALRFL